MLESKSEIKNQKSKITKKVAAKKTAAVREVSKPVKKPAGGLNANVYNTAGKVTSKLSLPKEIF